MSKNPLPVRQDMSKRPVWYRPGNDAVQIAQYLQSDEAKVSKFEPVAKPSYPPAILHQAALVAFRAALADENMDQSRLIIQEVRGLDDLVRAANLLLERLREMYALHAPELVRAHPDGKTLAHAIAASVHRDAVAEELEKWDAVKASIGTQLSDADAAVIQGFASSLDGVYQAWSAIEARLETGMVELAPNLTKLLGANLAARMIAQAGSLERMASMTTGSVQILGAETALFRHLKDGSLPPKHGLLFQHSLIYASPQHQRGPIAKALASVASVAAKADAWSKEDRTEMLQARLDARVAQAKLKQPKESSGYGKPNRGFPPRRDDRGPRREGGYQGGRDSRGPRRDDRPRSGGYQGNRDNDRGPRREGGYQGNKPRSGGYQGGRDGDRGPRREGGYQGGRSGGYQGNRDGDRPRGGGYQGNRDNDRGPRREGGYQGNRDGGDRGPRREGGYQGGKPRSGGYQGNKDGGRRDGPRDGPRDGKSGYKGKPGVLDRLSDKKGPAKPPGRDDR